MRNAKTVLAALVLLAFAGLFSPTAAIAKDAVDTAVVPGSLVNASSSRLDAVMNNGNPYANGTFAVGTIQLFYTVEGTTFPAGNFASFDMNMKIKLGPTTGQATAYPVNTLQLEQIGSKNIILTPAKRMRLEEAMEWIDMDELIEVTPNAIRIRKRFLLEHERKKAAREAA